MLPLRTQRLCVIVPLGGVLALVSVLGGQAQNKTDKAAGDSKKSLTPIVQGPSRCLDCHSKTTPPDADLPNLCRCTESLFWEHNDKHQDAYVVLNVLKNARAKRINDLVNPKTPPDKDPSCLGCHSMHSEDYEKSLTTEKEKSDYLRDIEKGVSCISCHGAVDDWIDRHGSAGRKAREEWRKWPRRLKEEKFGMIDLWDPVRRSEVCLSCHIGDSDPSKHRILTHEMYAAGHPPLPPFEVATFSNSLPRHWQLMREKDQSMQKELYQWNPSELEQVKLVVVGSATTFRESMKLLASQAEIAAKEANAENAGLDFAQFDCAACHHDLKNPSWRQKRGYQGPPGRPPVRPWSSALLNMCIGHASANAEDRAKLAAECKSRVAELQTAFHDRPYGDPVKIAKAARSLASWTDERIISKLNKEPDPKAEGATRFDVSASRELLKYLAQEIASLPATETPDFDAARQTAWAFRAIYEEVYAKYKDSQDTKDEPIRKAVLNNHPQIMKQLELLQTSLKLDLPNVGNGIADADYPKDPSKQKALADQRQGQLELFFPIVLKQTAEYDPEEFRRAFLHLAKLVP